VTAGLADQIALLAEGARGILDTYSAAAINRELVSSGWTDLLAEDPVLAVRSYFGEQGRTRRTSPALDVVVQFAAGMDVEPDIVVALPVPGRPVARESAARSGTVVIEGIVLDGWERSDVLLVPIGVEGKVEWLSLRRTDLEITPVLGIDPDLRLARVSGVAKPLSASVARSDPDWALPRVALAAELVGVAQTLLDRSCEHVAVRQQFGRPLGTNQAVKHRLADVAVRIAAAEAVLDAVDDSPTPVQGLVVKAAAGRAADVAVRAALQVCGAMGFTDDFGQHLFVRRAQALDMLLGSARELHTAAGAHIRNTGEVSPVVSL
jgi:hypothetical protein